MKKRKQWEYVKRKVERINQLIADGFIFVFEGSDLLTEPLNITEKNMRGCPEISSEASSVRWYEHNPDYDHGFHWTEKEIDRHLFDALRAYAPYTKPIFEQQRQVMLKVGGRSFRCECGCNVLTQLEPLKYRCNSCHSVYKGEKS